MDLTAPSAEQIPEPDAEPDLTVLVALGDFLEVEHSEGPAVEDGNEGDALAVVDDESSYDIVNEARMIQAVFAQMDDCRVDFDVPVILLCQHAGRPPYRLVLDIMEHPPVQKLRMWSNYNGRRFRTTYHGSWRASVYGTMMCVLRWFATEQNKDEIHLVSLQLNPVDGFRGLYQSSCQRIAALRLFAHDLSPDPYSAAKWACMIESTI